MSSAGRARLLYQAEGVDVNDYRVLMEGVVFGESPRWRDRCLWFSDWGANQVIALGPDGNHEVVATVPSFPM
jgi:sugar lactone lactonase YvrE